MGLELLRQVHYFVSERSAGYHRFWSYRVFGGFDRAMKRRFSDWTRFRLARAGQVDRVHRAVRGGRGRRSWRPRRCWRCSQAPALLLQALPLILQLAFAFFFIAFQFIGLFWLLSRGGVDTYYPDDIKTRFTDVWGQDHVVAAGPGEHHVPGEAGRDRGQGRLRPRRHPAVGPARHRQDADGRGRRRRDRQAVRLRRPRRVHQHVHGRRHPQGQVAVPEAAQARAALRRRDRVLRRGGRAGQPRLAGAGRRPAAARGMRPPFAPRGLPRLRPTSREDTRWLLARDAMAAERRDGAEHRAAAQPVRHGRRDGRRRRRDGHAAGAAHRAVRA